MISKVECIIIECDNCGEIFEDGSGFSIFVDNDNAHPQDHDWYCEGGKHYCPECHTLDDEDNLIINDDRTKICQK